MCKKSYDLQLIMSITRGRSELVLKIMQLFIRNTPYLLRQLELAYIEKDLLRFKNLVYEIRPSFGYFSIREVESDLEMAERLAFINLSGRSMNELINRILIKANCVMREMEIELQQIEGLTETSFKK